MPPRSRSGLIVRRRLFAMLDRRDDAALTLISAPAGSGKTELLSSWLQGHPDYAVAWVTLDARDSDPVRFWTSVAQAVDELMNGIGTFEGRLVIALDDLHYFTSGRDTQSLAYAAEHLAEPARVIATTRSDPLLRLGRLRTRGLLAEIRSRELAFTRAEAKELLVGSFGIDLDDEEVGLLVERTEGWPAGLSLAGLWLAELEEPGAHVREFSGDHRQVADYLSDEVLDTLDEPTRDFLLRTSVLERLCGPLCDAVLGTEGSHEMLAALTRANLFLIPLDRRGEWYRYHQLFRDLLRLELSQLDSTAAARLHERAAAWFLEHGLLEEALDHTAAAGDAGSVADLLAQEYLQLVRTGRSQILLTWLQWLPDHELRRHPELAAAGAVNAAMLGRSVDERGRLLQLAEATSGTQFARTRLRIELFGAMIRGGTLDRDLAVTIGDARHAVELAYEDGDEFVMSTLAGLAYALYLQGDLAGADTAAREALARVEAPQRPHGLILATACAALVEADRGHLRSAERTAHRSLAAAGHLGLTAVWSAGLARLALGQALLADGRSAEAEHQLERAELLRRAPHATLEHIHALLLLAEARIARGRLALAGVELGAAREQLDSFADAGRLVQMAQRLEQVLTIALATATARPGIEPPTPAELSVLRLLATDLTQREIGRQLYLSFNTVKTHTRRLYRKLGATTRADAVRRASEAGLLDAPGSPG